MRSNQDQGSKRRTQSGSHKMSPISTRGQTGGKPSKKILAHHTDARPKFQGSELGDFVRKKAMTWKRSDRGGRNKNQIMDFEGQQGFTDLKGSGEMKKIISFEKKEFNNDPISDFSNKSGGKYARVKAEGREQYVNMSYNVIVNGSQMINPSFNVVPTEREKPLDDATNSSLKDVDPKMSDQIISQNIRNSLCRNIIEEETKSYGAQGKKTVRNRQTIRSRAKSWNKKSWGAVKGQNIRRKKKVGRGKSEGKVSYEIKPEIYKRRPRGVHDENWNGQSFGKEVFQKWISHSRSEYQNAGLSFDSKGIPSGRIEDGQNQVYGPFNAPKKTVSGLLPRTKNMQHPEPSLRSSIGLTEDGSNLFASNTFPLSPEQQMQVNSEVHQGGNHKNGYLANKSANIKMSDYFGEIGVKSEHMVKRNFKKRKEAETQQVFTRKRKSSEMSQKSKSSRRRSIHDFMKRKYEKTQMELLYQGKSQTQNHKDEQTNPDRTLKNKESWLDIQWGEEHQESTHSLMNKNRRIQNENWKQSMQGNFPGMKGLQANENSRFDTLSLYSSNTRDKVLSHHFKSMTMGAPGGLHPSPRMRKEDTKRTSRSKKDSLFKNPNLSGIIAPKPESSEEVPVIRVRKTSSVANNLPDPENVEKSNQNRVLTNNRTDQEKESNFQDFVSQKMRSSNNRYKGLNEKDEEESLDQNVTSMHESNTEEEKRIAYVKRNLNIRSSLIGINGGLDAILGMVDGEEELTEESMYNARMSGVRGLNNDDVGKQSKTNHQHRFNDLHAQIDLENYETEKKFNFRKRDEGGGKRLDMRGDPKKKMERLKVPGTEQANINIYSSDEPNEGETSCDLESQNGPKIEDSQNLDFEILSQDSQDNSKKREHLQIGNFQKKMGTENDQQNEMKQDFDFDSHHKLPKKLKEEMGRVSMIKRMETESFFSARRHTIKKFTTVSEQYQSQNQRANPSPTILENEENLEMNNYESAPVPKNPLDNKNKSAEFRMWDPARTNSKIIHKKKTYAFEVKDLCEKPQKSGGINIFREGFGSDDEDDYAKGMKRKMFRTGDNTRKKGKLRNKTAPKKAKSKKKDPKKRMKGTKPKFKMKRKRVSRYKILKNGRRVLTAVDDVPIASKNPNKMPIKRKSQRRSRSRSKPKPGVKKRSKSPSTLSELSNSGSSFRKPNTSLGKGIKKKNLQSSKSKSKTRKTKPVTPRTPPSENGKKKLKDKKRSGPKTDKRIYNKKKMGGRQVQTANNLSKFGVKSKSPKINTSKRRSKKPVRAAKNLRKSVKSVRSQISGKSVKSHQPKTKKKKILPLGQLVRTLNLMGGKSLISDHPRSQYATEGKHKMDSDYGDVKNFFSTRFDLTKQKKSKSRPKTKPKTKKRVLKRKMRKKKKEFEESLEKQNSKSCKIKMKPKKIKSRKIKLKDQEKDKERKISEKIAKITKENNEGLLVAPQEMEFDLISPDNEKGSKKFQKEFELLKNEIGVESIQRKNLEESLAVNISNEKNSLKNSSANDYVPNRRFQELRIKTKDLDEWNSVPRNEQILENSDRKNPKFDLPKGENKSKNVKENSQKRISKIILENGLVRMDSKAEPDPFEESMLITSKKGKHEISDEIETMRKSELLCLDKEEYYFDPKKLLVCKKTAKEISGSGQKLKDMRLFACKVVEDSKALLLYFHYLSKKFKTLEQNSGQNVLKIRTMLKNPLSPINVQTRKEIDFFCDFMDTVKKARRYTCEKLRLQNILNDLELYLMNTRNILSKVLEWKEIRDKRTSLKRLGMDQEKKIENITLEELNKLLQQNKPLFLHKEQLFKKSSKCDLVLKKMILSRKLVEKSRARKLSLISKLEQCLDDDQSGSQIVEAIQFYADRELERQCADREGWMWNLRQTVKEAARREKELFEIFESQKSVSKKIKKKSVGLRRANEKLHGKRKKPRKEGKKKTESSSGSNQSGKSFSRMRSLSNKRPQKPPMLGGKSRTSKNEKKKRVSRKQKAKSGEDPEGDKPKETFQFLLLSDEDDESLNSPAKPNPNSLRLEKILNNYEPSPRGGNNANHRITFGTKINRLIKNSGNPHKPVSDLDSIFSFKNVSIFSRGESFSNATRDNSNLKTSPNTQLKELEPLNFDLQVSSSSFKTNSTHKKYETSMEETGLRNRSQTEGVSIEKYSAYRDLKNRKMTDGNEQRLTESLSKDEKNLSKESGNRLRDSEDTIKNSGEGMF